MSTTLAQVETKVLNFLAAEAAVEPVIAQADTWAMTNECYLEYIARFTNAWITSATGAGATPSVLMGSTTDGQWIDCENAEVWDGATLDPDTGLAVYTPLKRRTEGQILYVTRTEGATGRPRLYSLALRNRSLTVTRSQFILRVYPIPNATFTYRCRIRAMPTAELVAGGDVLAQIDDEQAEQIAAWTAARMATTLGGYSNDHVQKIADLLPPQLRAELDLIDSLAWPWSEPRRVGELVEAT